MPTYLDPHNLYCPMNNIYRETFVFDCAKADRKFYFPKDGYLDANLQDSQPHLPIHGIDK